ncbi:MAG TPA: hypothetical protein VFC78_13080 [Tepidisphaeraceae bacterium]|nr:hypothetical protein [Tepidisphaeraceae bacterium]
MPLTSFIEVFFSKPPMSPRRLFLLSPAYAGGKRAGYLLREGADFELARQMHAQGGAPIGDVLAFLSGLYFRGKLAYARAFAAPPGGVAGGLVITPDRGLLPMDALVTLNDLRGMATVPVDAADARYREPLLRDAMELATALKEDDEVVLLGSIATGKYVDVLDDALCGRLRFPAEFVGRGDMSRGGLMLRCAAAGEELRYVPIAGACRRGKRPARLGPPVSGAQNPRR